MADLLALSVQHPWALALALGLKDHRVVAAWDPDVANTSRWRTSDDFALVFEGVVRLADPVPATGMLGFWRVPDELAARARVQGTWQDWDALGKPYRGTDDRGMPIPGTCVTGRCDCAPGADCFASCPHVPGTVCVCACHHARAA